MLGILIDVHACVDKIDQDKITIILKFIFNDFTYYGI